MACALLNGLQRCFSNVILKQPVMEGNCRLIATPQKLVLDTSEIIYGVSDRGEVDFGGVSVLAKGNQSTKDWLEDIIPALTEFEVVGVNVYEIKPKDERAHIAPDKALFVVDVPDSHRAPHQSRGDSRYYVRLGAKSRPASHRLIEDIRNRQVHPNVNLGGVELAYAVVKRKSSANTECALRADLLLRIANLGRIKAVNVCVLTRTDRVNLRAGNPEAVEIRAAAQSGELIWELKHPVYPESSVPLRISFSVDAEYRVVKNQTVIVPATGGDGISPDDIGISWTIFADSAPPAAGLIRMGDMGFCSRALQNFSGP